MLTTPVRDSEAEFLGRTEVVPAEMECGPSDPSDTTVRRRMCDMLMRDHFCVLLEELHF